MNLKKVGKLFTSKFVGTGPTSYEKRIYRAAVSQRLRITAVNTYRCFGGTWCLHHQDKVWRQQDPPVRWYVPIKLHGVTLQQTVILKRIPGLDNRLTSYLYPTD